MATADPINPAPGDIYTSYESVMTPACVALFGDEWLKKRQADIDPSLAPQGANNFHRPCLVMPYSKGQRPIVCAITSFDKTPREELAEVFQHFLAPISPNKYTVLGEFVLHPAVPWRDEGYIITIPFRALHYLRKPHYTGSTHSQVTPEEMHRLQEEIDYRMKEWIAAYHPRIGEVIKDYNTSHARYKEKKSLDLERKGRAQDSSPSHEQSTIGSHDQHSESLISQPVQSPATSYTTHSVYHNTKANVSARAEQSTSAAGTSGLEVSVVSHPSNARSSHPVFKFQAIGQSRSPHGLQAAREPGTIASRSLVRTPGV
ncbi:hypothetical protein FA95DRAFT_1575957 [Auriscalpium vulgare]|uniref:Uncharacterized protein n=1 Tax=Auriscalpium vulgare TaxID=40419 RepID=A0ACB8RD13_9AGAM|nr:hypothetical protein FA95DRAFT_1575957 [Auriscalpium vulgare]